MKVASFWMRFVWVAGLVVVLAGAAGGGLFNAGKVTVTGDSPGLPGVVSFGHVDVEDGIAGLSPLQPGRVAAVLVKEGQEVAAGAVLVKLEDGLAKLRVQEAKAALDAAQVRLDQAKKLPAQHKAKVAQLEAALRGLRHQASAAGHQLAHKKKLLDIGQIGAEDHSAAKDQADQLEELVRAEEARLRELQLHDPAEGIRQAEAEIATIAARLEQARHAQDECYLKAPRAGTVLRIHVAPGDVFGGQPRRPAVEFCPGGRRVVRAEVNQEFARGLREGQLARVEDEANPEGASQGRVVRISGWYTQRRSMVQEPLQVNDVRTLECLIALDGDQPGLRIGQRMRVTIVREK